MASVSPSSTPEESPPDPGSLSPSSSEVGTESPPSSKRPRLQSPSSSASGTESSPTSSSPETSSASGSSCASPSLLPELNALREPLELTLEQGLPDNAAILRYCRLLRKHNNAGKMSDILLAKSVADTLVAAWTSVAKQFSGNRLMAPHNITMKVKNLITRYKFAFNDCGTRIPTKQQNLLAQDAPRLFDIRSCR